MSAASPLPRGSTASQGRKLLRGVELFYSGTHTDSEGKVWTCTPDDIERIVQNFKLLSEGERPVLSPPIGMDHDTAKKIPDAMLSNTKFSFGEVVELKSKDAEINGEKVRLLVGDIALDPTVKNWVDSGNLVRLSPEILDEPPPEGAAIGAKGSTLRRLALLGYSLPALKFLKPLQTYAETAKRARRFFIAFPKKRSFSEGQSMDRAAMIQFLQDAGWDTSLITEAVPDTLLQMIVDLVKGTQGDTSGLSDQKKPGDPPSQIMVKFSEMETNVAKQLAKINQKNAALEQQIAARFQAQDGAARRALVANIRSFSEQAVKDRRLTPADVECDKDGNPLPGTVLARLMRAAESPTVHSFSDGGKTKKLTELELQMDEITKRRPMNFSERVSAGAPGVQGDEKGKYDLIRESAKASRAPVNGRSLHDRLGLLKPNAFR